ncbi:MAG: beta-N-acetylhexosaminidase [Ginsengibacter sp.]
MKVFFYPFLILYSLSASAKDHNPILPQPQKIHYGNGAFNIKNVTIGFASKASTEDRFAAQELADILSQAGSEKIIVKESAVTGSSIIFKRTGKIGALPVIGEKPGPGSREYYQIKVTPKNITIIAVSSAGLYYAVQTLRQLVEGSGEKAVVPEVEIEDWPSFAYRGFMMDMSHMQFPRVEEIKNQINFLARWKTNQYYFYSEASIELGGYPLLMANARYTKKQVKDIIAYAKSRHIDVVPNMELYGHLHDLFKLEHYADLSVTEYGGEFKPKDPRVKTILNDWITQISKLFPSPFFHIGFDETWVIELEAKKLNQSADQLYLDMLTQTTNMVEKQGKQPLVWADMLQKFHSIIPKMSQKIVAVAWHYFPLKEPEYDTLLSPFPKAGIPLFVQAASINWHWFYPAFEVSFQNNDSLINAGRKHNAVGYINSGWTDDPQTLMRLSWPDMAYGSIASWQSQPIDQGSFFKKYSQILYPAPIATTIEKAHLTLMQSESFLRKAVGQTDHALWEDPFSVKSLQMYESNKENLHQGRLAAEEAQVYLRDALKSGFDTTSLFAMLTGAKQLDLLAAKYLYAGSIAELYKKYSKNRDAKEFTMMMGEVTAYYHSKIVDMFDAVTETKEMFRKAWLDEYTSFRLGIPMAKFDMELQYWFKIKKKLDSLSKNYKDNEEFPSLQSLLEVQ